MGYTVSLDTESLEAVRQATIATTAALDAAGSSAAALAAAGLDKYIDTATGIASTAVGDKFWVDNNDGTGSGYRHDAGPVATFTHKFIINPFVSGFATLTDAATVTPDFSTADKFTWTIGGNRTLANPTNARIGQMGIIVIVQDATGNRTLSYGSNWRFPGGAAIGGLLSTTANAVDLLSYYVRSDGTIIATLNRGFAA